MRIAKSLTGAGIVLLFAVSLLYAKQPEKIEKTVDGSIETRKQSQEKGKKWHAEKDRLKSRYFQLKEEIEIAKLEENRMQGLVERQDAYLTRVQKKLIELEKIRQGLIPYLEELLARTQTHVEGDLPFLKEERKLRMENLETYIYDPEISLGEKLRRVFEGLRVELEYGRSVEVTKEEIFYNNEKLLVKVLRVGRTALLMHTLDEEEVAIYSDGWHRLPGKYKDEIKKAIAIAQKNRPIEFVNLPLKVTAK
jgi:hypothetical protein